MDQNEGFQQILEERQRRAAEAIRRIQTGVYGEQDVQTLIDELGINHLMEKK